MPFSNKDPQLLRAIILEHYQHPQNKVETAPTKGNYLAFHNKSTSCIDDFTVYLKVDNHKVTDAVFAGIGCAISTAAASITTTAIKGMDVEDARTWLNNFAKMINGGPYDEQLLGEGIAFHTINKLPSRANCAMAVPDPLRQLIGGVLNRKAA